MIRWFQQFRKWSLRVAVSLSAVILLCCFSWSAAFPFYWQKPVDVQRVGELREEPICIDAVIPPTGLPDGDFGKSIVEKMDPANRGGKKLSASHALHILSALGLEAQYGHERFSDGSALIELLTDSVQATEYFGHPVMLTTEYGVRPVSGYSFGLATQAHRDQVLSCFAQLGVSRRFPMVVEGESHEFGEILRDSIANFHLGQEELEFTSIAYALFLPPNLAWTNKLNEEFGFDDLVKELLSRRYSRSHCFATHLAEAMILIYRVDSEIAELLSKPSRELLRSRIDETVRAIVDAQRPDGSWNGQWYLDLEKETDSQRKANGLTDRLITTGHLVQLLGRLPGEEYVIDGSVFRRAIAWLEVNTNDLDNDFIIENFCPCSHAAWCLNECH